MRSLKWSTSHAVFVTEIDDEHKEIFEVVSKIQTALESDGQPAEISKLTHTLATCVADHFAHEERLMRAARYSGMRWHKQQHENARKRVGQFARQIEQGDTGAGFNLVDYLARWLAAHTSVADRMMGASLRNHERFLCKVTFRAGTKPMDACAWVDARGNKFDPSLQ